MEATGFLRRSSLEKYLRKNKISFFVGKNQTIWTTVEALNTALGITQQFESEIEFI